jgi:hypothetical protein
MDTGAIGVKNRYEKEYESNSSECYAIRIYSS